MKKMSATNRRLSFVSTVVVAFGVGYVLGINRGYTDGYSAALNSTSAEAATVASVLEALDAEQRDHAKLALEAHLDTLLVNNSVGRSVSPLVLQRWLFPDLQESIDQLAARGASYRLQNPRAGFGLEYREIVDDAANEILARSEATSVDEEK